MTTVMLYNILLYQYTNVLTYQHPIYQHTCVPMTHYNNIPVYQCIKSHIKSKRCLSYALVSTGHLMESSGLR